MCAENNVSICEDIISKKTSVVNHWEFSLNSDDSGAESEILVL